VVNAVDDHSHLPSLFEGRRTPYVAISASLQWGPWGPSESFHAFNQKKPFCLTDDTTIAIYLRSDVEGFPPVLQDE
jgi:hypothetical protein